MKKFNLALLIFAAFTGCSLNVASNSKNEIDTKNGVFGVKFGEKANNLKIISQLEPNAYLINTPLPSKDFTNYGVEVTPKSKEVYSIIAMALYDSKQKCENEKIKTVNLLQKDYGNFIAYPDEESRLFLNDDLMIYVDCNDGFSLGVNYTDLLLYEKAKVEEQSL